jgi:RNA polymerase sigma factor (sigma-70 family)
MDRIEDFHELLARARSGDPAAADKLLAAMRPWIEKVALDQPLPPNAAGSVSDIIQEAWLRAWQKLDQFQGSTDEAQSLAMFRAWLARIVTRLGFNSARDARAQGRTPPGRLLRLDGAGAGDPSLPTLDPPASEPTPSANVGAAEQMRLVQETLARLTDPLDCDIIRLRFLEGLSLRQVAHRLSCNHETIRQRYHALLGRLQQDLKGLQ